MYHNKCQNPLSISFFVAVVVFLQQTVNSSLSLYIFQKSVSFDYDEGAIKSNCFPHKYVRAGKECHGFNYAFSYFFSYFWIKKMIQKNMCGVKWKEMIQHIINEGKIALEIHFFV